MVGHESREGSPPPGYLEAVGAAFDVEQVELVQARACNVLADGLIASMAMDWRAPHYREPPSGPSASASARRPSPSAAISPASPSAITR